GRSGAAGVHVRLGAGAGTVPRGRLDAVRQAADRGGGDRRRAWHRVRRIRRGVRADRPRRGRAPNPAGRAPREEVPGQHRRDPGPGAQYDGGAMSDQAVAAKNWRIGVAGLGTVGTGLLKYVTERPDFAPAGGRVSVAGVSARSRSRPRPFDISGLPWFDDPVALATSPDVDVFVELIGGSDGPAKAAVQAALSAGKPVVPANKAAI